MMGLWREQESYSEDGPFLILSGGDNWTGPAISTWFKGESMVDVMTTIDGYFLSDGTAIHSDSIYQVLTTDYLYSRDDLNFSMYDPDPYNTSIHYRQPVIDWIQSLQTSSTDPLNNYLDNIPRR